MEGIKQRLRSVKFNEHFNQAQLFYNSLTPHEQQHLINALSFELNKLDELEVIEKMIERLSHVDLELATEVANNVGGTPPTAAAQPNHGKKSSFLSQEAFKPKKPTIKYVPTSKGYSLLSIFSSLGRERLLSSSPMDSTWLAMERSRPH